MAEPFLCQGLWQIRDLKLSAGLRNTSEFLKRDEEKTTTTTTTNNKTPKNQTLGYGHERLQQAENCPFRAHCAAWRMSEIRQHTWLNGQGTVSWKQTQPEAEHPLQY